MSIERQEPLQNLGVMIARIHGTSGTGRLAMRNTTRMGMLHLYFERGRLVHAQGTRASVDDLLIDLAGWREGQIRFDVGVLPERHTVTAEQEQFFQQTLVLLQQSGAVRAASRPLTSTFSPGAPLPPLPLEQPTPSRLQAIPPLSSRPAEYVDPLLPPFVPPGGASRPPGREYTGRGNSGAFSALPPLPPNSSAPLPPLLTGPEWELLVEVVRALLEGVGQLFGRRQAQNILRNVLAEQSEHLPVLGVLQVDRDGWLRELHPGEMQTQPLDQVAEGFVLLISDFERRCAILLGEERARQMITLSLHRFQEDLAEIGIAVNAG